MNITLSTHDIHREQLRYQQLGPQGYFDRVTTRIKEPKKFVAVLIYLSYRVYAGFIDDQPLLEFVGRQLRQAEVSSFLVKKSRPHDCQTDKTYRIDEYVDAVTRTSQ